MKVTLVKYDDWEGFYVDGELKAQDHKISVEMLFELIEWGKVIDFQCRECYSWWNENEPDGFPQKLEDVKFD